MPQHPAGLIACRCHRLLRKTQKPSGRRPTHQVPAGRKTVRADPVRIDLPVQARARTRRNARCASWKPVPAVNNPSFNQQTIGEDKNANASGREPACGGDRTPCLPSMRFISPPPAMIIAEPFGFCGSRLTSGSVRQCWWPAPFCLYPGRRSDHRHPEGGPGHGAKSTADRLAQTDLGLSWPWRGRHHQEAGCGGRS